MRYQYVNGERRLVPASGRGSTNDIGEFRLFGLPPGDYFVAARLQNGMSAGRQAREPRRLCAHVLSGDGNPGDAQRIAIDAGQVVSGISLTLMPVRDGSRQRRRGSTRLESRSATRA